MRIIDYCSCARCKSSNSSCLKQSCVHHFCSIHRTAPQSPILQELSLTDNKPIISNGTVIPAAEAETFPTLKGLVNLHEEVVDIPDFFTRNNRECFACMVLCGVILALTYYH